MLVLWVSVIRFGWLGRVDHHPRVVGKPEPPLGPVGFWEVGSGLAGTLDPPSEGGPDSAPSPPRPRSSSVLVLVSPSFPRSVVVHTLVCREPLNQLSHIGFSSPF